jgi:predicted nucleic acid-binding protein
MAGGASGDPQALTSGVAVFDSSALIIFRQIDRLELLSGLFVEILVPAAVKQEVAPSLGSLPSWIQERTAPTPPTVTGRLDPGEREAIALALGLATDFVVLDDLPARRVARRLGLEVIGSVGLLLRALEYGLIETIQPDLDAMLEAGLYISQRLYREVLKAAGELP